MGRPPVSRKQNPIDVVDRLFDPADPRGAAPPRFGALAPVAASEVLHGSVLLAAAGRG